MKNYVNSVMKNSDIDKLIEYVNSLEIAHGLIDNEPSLDELKEFKYKLKKIKEELGFIIEDFDKKFSKEFYGDIE